MFCTKCGNQIKDGFKFCPKCGAHAYVEKEKAKCEVKEEVDEVAKEANVSVDSEPVVKSTEKTKKTTKTDTASNIKKKETDSAIHDDLIPNPLIAKELDFEGVEKKAHKGSIDAKLRLAFRYEKGIGCGTDHLKAEELLSSIDDNIIPNL